MNYPAASCEVSVANCKCFAVILNEVKNLASGNERNHASLDPSAHRLRMTNTVSLQAAGY